MGREIRRVPPGWEHPKNERGHYEPLYNRDFETAARTWLDRAIAWDNGTHPDLQGDPALKTEYPFFWQWDGGPPDPDYYRPRWSEEPTHYQVYETVSEGTPMSPVFANLEDLIAWCITQGYTRHAAERFAATGWAPSMVMSGGMLASNIAVFDILPEPSKDAE